MKLTSPITVLGKIKDGKVGMKNKAWFFSRFEGIDDCNVKWIVEKERRPRSRKLENYLWGCVYPIASQSLGYRPEELHSIFKSMFLKSKKLWRGADVETIRSTTDLAQDEYSNFVEEIRKELSALSIVTQDPDKYYKERNEFGDEAVNTYIHKGR